MASPPPPAARIVMPVYPQVDMLDVCGPYEMFRWANIQVDLVTAEPGAIPFGRGFTFNVDSALPQPRPYDAIWVPGGNPDALAKIIADPASPLLAFITAQAAQSTYVCSVCEGCLLLAAAGLVDGYTVTTHWAFIPYLLERYPKVALADGHPRFWLDRNRLTGGGISSGLDEALKLIELLLGTAAAQDVQQTTQYYPDPPVHSAIPNTITSPMPD